MMVEMKLLNMLTYHQVYMSNKHVNFSHAEEINTKITGNPLKEIKIFTMIYTR